MNKKYNYLPADTSYLINANVGLKPIRISLPKPPQIELIDGYGKAPLEQRFERQVIPERLNDLIQSIKRRLQKEERSGTNSKSRVTPQKLIDEIWEELEQNENKYQSEIEWIKRQWYFILNGYWFFCKGKPTYITGAHYLLLNFWKLSDVDGGGYFEYRHDRDRLEFLFMDYASTTHETFADLDKDGYAIKTNGVYKIKRLPARTCLGIVQPKNRRGGNSTKGMVKCYHTVFYMVGKLMGIQSYSGDNAAKLYKDKFVQGWQSLPFFLRPVWDGSNNPAEGVNFEPPRNSPFSEALRGRVDYAKNADSTFYDSKKLHAGLFDEEGKGLKEGDISKRWKDLKKCMTLGDAPIGFSYHPSNVKDMDAQGGIFYESISNNSDFYQRNKANGQTISGLFRMFFPATCCLENHVDYWGHSVEKDPTPEQKKYGYTKEHGSVYTIMSERELLLAKGTAEALDELREIKKLMPISYEECFLGSAALIGFNIEKLDTRIPEINENKELIVGNFKRRANDVNGDVYFEADPEGRFIVSELLDPYLTNKRTSVNIFNPILNEWDVEFAPKDGTKFVMGADPFDFGSDNTSKVKGLSKGGGSTLKRRDKNIDSDILREDEWKTYHFVCTYLYRPSTIDEYCEDMLMCAQYYGSMMFIETNKSYLWQYIVKRGYGGYLLYMIDGKGEINSKPGQYTSDSNRDEMFKLFGKYIETHIHKEKHVELMRDAKAIKGVKDMTHYDRLTAAMLALRGDTSMAFERMERTMTNKVTVNKWFKKHSY